MPIWVYAVGVVIGLLVLCKVLLRKMGCSCHNCSSRMHFWDELEESDKQDILAYFQHYENRTPDTSSIFVCPNCRYLYDDFSGEKRSMDGDNNSICKVCGFPHIVSYFDHFGAKLNHEAF